MRDSIKIFRLREFDDLFRVCEESFEILKLVPFKVVPIFYEGHWQDGAQAHRKGFVRRRFLNARPRRD